METLDGGRGLPYPVRRFQQLHLHSLPTARAMALRRQWSRRYMAIPGCRGQVSSTGTLPPKADLPMANVRFRPFPSGLPSSPDVSDDPG
jgi:hypothetical protein